MSLFQYVIPDVLDAREVGLAFLILVTIVISVRIYRARTPGPLSMADGLQGIITAATIVGLVGSYIGYKNGNETDLTKASVDVRRKVIESINQDSRAAIELLKSSEYSEFAAKALAKSTPISLKYNDRCQCRARSVKVEDYFGYLAIDGLIDEGTVNALRFSLVKLLNEFESTIILLNSGIVDCEQIYDLVEELMRQPSFAAYDRFIKQYDNNRHEKDDSAPPAWAVVQEFNRVGSNILNRAGKSPDAFCRQYKRLYRGKDSKYLLYPDDVIASIKLWLRLPKTPYAEE
jgi:hypothetical protein